MRPLIVSEFLTLDGVMQAPGAPDEDRSGGFEHGGWQTTGDYFDDTAGRIVTEGIAGAGGLVLGRKTYEIFAGYWPNAPDEEASIRDPLNEMPKHVASRTLSEPLAWNNSTLISGDLAEGIRALKAQEGNHLLVIGSGNLVQSLMTNELVDEYRVMIHPLLLGSGARLFREGSGRQPLCLVDVTPTDKGVIFATYRPAEK
jgi:dihydrofolate reductase